MLGIEVRTDAERNIGRIVDLLADDSGHVQAAVIEFGGFLGMGSRKIAIEWSALHLETSGKQTVATLDLPREELRAAPDYKPEQPIVLRKVAPLLPPAQSQATPTQMTPPTETPPTAQQAPPQHATRKQRTRRHHHRKQDD